MRRISKILVGIGFACLLISVSAVTYLHILSEIRMKEAAKIVSQVDAVVTETSRGEKDDYAVMDMPVLQVEGQDFLGIISVPQVNMRLPIYSMWDEKKISSFPCRFYGTAYDGSLVIGGADQNGQFEALKYIETGWFITVRDMLGKQFYYEVNQILRMKKEGAIFMNDEQTDLTLFVWDDAEQVYICVRCTME